MFNERYRRENVPLKDFFGAPYPEYFVHPVAEYLALTTSAGVIDLTHWRTFRVSGADRQSFLNAMLTADVGSIDKDHGTRALITTIKGKIIAELLVFPRPDDVLVLVPQGHSAGVFDVLTKHIIMEDVTVEDASDDYGVIGIEGPKAIDVLWRLFSTGPFPKDPLGALEREFGGNPCYLMNHSVTGQNGYQLLLSVTEMERMLDYVVQAARGSDGLPVGGIAWNMRRTEYGHPWFGTDFDDENFPDEARMGHLVDYDKGCFTGQETLARLHHRGHVNRMLVGLTTDDDAAPLTGGVPALFEGTVNNYDEVGLKERARAAADKLDLSRFFPHRTPVHPVSPTGQGAGDDSPVGWITTAVFSPVLTRPLVLGVLRREQIEAESDVRVDVGEQKIRLTPIDLPLSPADA